jgi:Tfp pilus assembly protein PilZ
VDLNSDHRQNRRFAYEAVIRHDNLLPGVFYAAKMYNLSKGGVYFESDQILYPGESIYIGLKHSLSGSHEAKDCVRVEIKWRKDLYGAAFQYGYGSRFMEAENPLLEMMGISEIHDRDDRIGDSAVKKDPREHPRELSHKPVSLICRNRCDQGLITDISRGGAFIATDQKFSLGRKVQIRIPGDNEFKAVTLKGWIVRINHNGVAIRFDRRSGKDRRRNVDRRRKKRPKAKRIRSR